MSGYAPTADERAVIGVLQLKPELYDDITARLTAPEFGDPKCRRAFDTIVRLHDTDQALNAPTIARELAGSGGDEDAALEWLLECQRTLGSTGQWSQHCNTISEWAARRTLLRVGPQLREWGEHLPEVDAATMSNEVAAALEEAERLAFKTEVRQPIPLYDFFAGVDDTPDWLIPGVLERGDRVIVVAPEGVGKSWLLRQLVFQAACGAHPWGGPRYVPRRGLIIDLEVGERLLSRSLRRLNEPARQQAGYDPNRIDVLSVPEGLNVLHHTDRSALRQWVGNSGAEVVAIGPLYKLWGSSMRSNSDGGEEEARRVAHVLDDLRVMAGVTLLLEHHAPKGSGGARHLDAFGSAVWKRWPEMGITISPPTEGESVYEVGRFRGDRDAREWPEGLIRAQLDDHRRWPWLPAARTTMI
ncbi:MAG: AAA family ATPase [Actinomycetota bacterium]